MKQDYLEMVRHFNLNTLPDLDEVVLAALQYLTHADLPNIDTELHSRPLVIGSGNALRTGRILFRDTRAQFASESNYATALKKRNDYDAVYVVSASGGKHATKIAEGAQALDVPLFLITNNEKAPAAEFIAPENLLVFPRIREPYTYNTSTYLGMLFSEAKDRPGEVFSFIESAVLPRIPVHLSSYDAFTLIVPPELELISGFLTTKFDELFGTRVTGRAFTSEEIKHAKTVVPYEKELFVSFGVQNTQFGERSNRLFVPLPDQCGLAAMMAIGYSVIGHIQKQHPPYFKENVVAYTQFATELFGHPIEPIVE